MVLIRNPAKKLIHFVNRVDTYEYEMYMYWLHASTDDELPIANLAKFGFGKRF